jgi:regulator of replication initiation timing
MIGMNQIKNDIRAVFKDEFMEIEEENLKLKLERDNLKNKLQELNSMDDLNTPQAKELINSLILLL